MIRRPFSIRRPILPLVVGDPPPRFELRTMLFSDLPAVLRIEAASHEGPAGEMAFREALDRGAIGTIAALPAGDPVVGFCLHERCEKSIHVLDLAVAPHARRLGVASLLLDRVRRSLAFAGRDRVEVDVPERLLVAQKFLAARGFRAVPDREGRYVNEDYGFGTIRFRCHIARGVDTGCERGGE